MFSKLAVVFAASLALFAVAAPAGHPSGDNSVCSTGKTQCCNSLQNAHDKQAAQLLGLLGIVTGALTGQVGVTCSPITALGIAGNQCNAQAVCCNDTSFHGVVALGCTPINVGA
ncbi:hypothetical protein APHAL10511_004000 [Amanita phalloides]|nr:hypothetical protein APHAL10511_004000 [Amanita phalloides]